MSESARTVSRKVGRKDLGSNLNKTKQDKDVSDSNNH